MSSPIRILRVIPRYAPAWRYGGGVRFAYDLDRELARRGFAVTVYTSDQVDDATRAAARDEWIDGIQVSRFPNVSNYLADRFQWISYFPLGLRRGLMREAGRVDVMHVAEARGPHVRWAAEAARRGGIPLVWSPFGGLARGVGIRRPYRRLYDVVCRTRHLLREAQCLVAQSAHEAATIEELGARPSQVTIIGLGVDARRFRDLPARGAFRQSLAIAGTRPMVLFVGRFHRTKGLDVLLEAAAIVKRVRPDLAVVLVGWNHGALGTVRRLRRRLGLEDTVFIVPPLFDRAAVQAYVDADVFALAANTYEEMSLAALEALAAGTPCVLTRQCEIPDLEALGGGRVAACEAEPFAAALLNVLDDPMRQGRAQAARRAVLASCTHEQRADAYAALFRDLAGCGTLPVS